jgi:hypothetical protein
VRAPRADGFHELRTVFQAIALHDVIECVPRQGPFAIECDTAGVPLDRSNLVWKAAEAFWRSLRRTGPVQDMLVRLRKQIPLQAGLGGGSADAAATLLLPRDGRVVRDARPEEILGALTGVTFAPADLAAILTGCVTAAPRPLAGRVHGNGWASIDLEGGATVYLRREGSTWRVRAARRDGWQIDYAMWQGSFPASVRLQSESPRVDLTAAVSQLEVNVDLDASAFALNVPSSARPLSVAELRDNGPLRGER